MNDPFRSWADRYDREVGDVPPRHRPAAQRAQLLFSARRRAQASWLGRGRVFALSAAVAAGVCALVIWGGSTQLHESREPQALLGDRPVRVGALIDAHHEAKVMRFAQGSTITLEQGSSGSVSKLTERDIELNLAGGTLDIDVAKKAGRRWVVSAGDFKVHVVGTAFTVSRDAATEAFRVHVTRGKVRIQGPELEDGELLLSRGEEFRWRRAPVRVEAPLSKLALEDVQARHEEVPRASSPAKEPSSSTAGAKKLEETWQSLASSGKYELAVEMVQAKGSSQVLGSASPEDLLLLGNAARYSGHIDLGSRAYQRAREVPGPSATLAAYYLAKVALDSNGDQRQAITWLQTYLRESPRGDLSASARARLMTLLGAAGRKAEAQTVARDYLNLHPGGPQTQVAKRLLDQP